MPTIEPLTVQSLQKFLDDFEGSVAAGIRPSAQAAAQVLYDEVKRNVSQIKEDTGNLNRSIYQAFSPENSITGQQATYRVSWNTKKAPHAGLIEGGRLQRYEVFKTKDGRILTAVRPEMRGKPRPSKRASQAVKDAYYVPLKGGPRQVPGKFFVRKAIDKFAKAQEAALIKLKFVLDGGFNLTGKPFPVTDE